MPHEHVRDPVPVQVRREGHVVAEAPGRIDRAHPPTHLACCSIHQCHAALAVARGGADHQVGVAVPGHVTAPGQGETEGRLPLGALDPSNRLEARALNQAHSTAPTRGTGLPQRDVSLPTVTGPGGHGRAEAARGSLALPGEQQLAVLAREQLDPPLGVISVPLGVLSVKGRTDDHLLGPVTVELRSGGQER